MSGENGRASPAAESAPPAATSVETKDDATKTTTEAPAAPAAAAAKSGAEPVPAAAAPAPAPAAADPTAESDKAPQVLAERPAAEKSEKPDVEMTTEDVPLPPDHIDGETPEPAQAEVTGDSAAGTAAAQTPKPKTHRKSIGGGPGSAKAKKLNKKASKPRLLHLDAEPGDHYFVKLKGFPQWPVIICDEDMLPASLLKSRPVTAKRADGTYREDYADGGKNVADRTFPVMYLDTNEFGWVPNTELIDLDPATVLDVNMDKMRKALQSAHHLAAESHPLSFYKEVLQNYQEQLIEQEKAKAAKAATPKGKKAKAVVSDDEDVDMDDAPEVDETPAKEKKAKKRKAEESAETPQRSDSVKKPKIKLTTSSTSKAANGAAAAPKAAKTGEAKSTKSKSKKKDADEKKAEKEAASPKEPEMSAEDKHARKGKEVLFLRHKLQKGLLTRDQEPREEEMKLMSDYVTKLEGFPDLEVSIIRLTKINKVLKAILKLDNIPKEDEFRFKSRSQALLDKWNKLLSADGTPAAEGVNGGAADKPAGKTNGVGSKSGSEPPAKAASEEAKEESGKSEAEEESKGDEAEKEAAKPVEEAAEKPAEETKAPEAVEASA